MFDYQDYRNRYSQHVLFYEAGVGNRQQVYDAKVAIIGLGSIGIEAARLLAIAQVQRLRFIYWEETGHGPPGGAQSNRRRGVPAQWPYCGPRVSYG